MGNDSGSKPRVEMSQWVVYSHPRDYPDKFVVRRWDVCASTMIATNDMHIADSLDAIREAVPAGLYRLARFEEDDPCIVEVWL